VLGGADGTVPAAVVGVVGLSYWALTRTGMKKAAKAMENFMVARRVGQDSTKFDVTKEQRTHEIV
jgi:hypothetical protein